MSKTLRVSMKGVICGVAVFALLAQAEVVDFSHLFDDLDAEQEERSGQSAVQQQATPAPVVVDTVLVSRLAELEQLVAVRDRQIQELKQALEEMTSEFGLRIAAMRSQRGDDASLEVAELRIALKDAEAELALRTEALADVRAIHAADLEGLRKELLAQVDTRREDTAGMEAEFMALRAEKESDLEALRKELATQETARLAALAEQEQALVSRHAAAVASLEAEHQNTVRALQQELLAVRTAKDSDLEGLRNDLAAQENAQHRAMAEQEQELVSRHAAIVADLAFEHKNALTALQQEFTSFRADTKREREEAGKLRNEITRLEAALRVALTANERERFLLAYNSGSLFLAAGRYDRAEQEFLKALAIREDDAALQYNMGVLYDSHLRQPAKARRHYERFLELAPNDRDAPLVIQWLRELR
ncbi:MAG: hypothetical protein ACNA71_07775 [Kiritimatiellia bacterium]